MEVQQFVSITPWTIIFQICNLLILVALMKKFLFKPVTRILDARQQAIDHIYADAEADRGSAAQLKAAYAQKLSAARDEADRLVRGAVDAANQKSDEIVDDARQAAVSLKRRAEDEIAQERRKAYSQLKGEISSLAVDIAEQMVGREINAGDQAALVEDFIRDAGDEK